MFLKTYFERPVKNIDKKHLKKMNCCFIVIGDGSVSKFIKKDIDFSVAVVDYKTKRESITNDERRIVNKAMHGRKIVRIKNRAGTISDETIKTVKDWLKNQEKIFIIIDGEDDLVAVPFILLAPKNKNYCIVYGIRDEGIIIKKITPEFKRLVKKETGIEIA